MKRFFFENIRLLVVLSVLATGLSAVSCSTHKKLSALQKGDSPAVQLNLAQEESYIPEIGPGSAVTRDTLKIKDDNGSEILIMRAVRDEDTGEMVANDVLEAATVTARFRNVAERQGKVDLAFQVMVPKSMMDSKWQLRFYPDMFVLGDSLRLDPVVITGAAYRKAQLKGYQQYDRFLSKIIDDTTRFVNLKQLEYFLKRNIPQLYAFKTDSTYVSDEAFYSIYGVTEQEAVSHYTNTVAKKRNERRKARMDKMYRRYVKAPIVTEGIRLDTVMVASTGDFIYNYVQTINTRPKLRKVDIVLSGEIYELEECLYVIPRSEPLTFYISSLSAFTDNTERYLKKVVERRASANTECRIDFEVGRAEVKAELGDNASGIRRIKHNLASLVNNEEFDLDSIVITATASPEGSYEVNSRLAQRRSESVTEYFEKYVKEYGDSLVAASGVSMNLDGSQVGLTKKAHPIKFTARSVPENWSDLKYLVENDVVMDDGYKESFRKLYAQKDPDRREWLMHSQPYYKYMRSVLYPKLRTVKFNFYLHRKGMVKDTVHTTVIDSVYMRGVQALRDMDYAKAASLLGPYRDFNTALAFMGQDRNVSAMSILKGMERTAEVNYLLALLYSRRGDEKNAVECYVRACGQDRSYVYRGNLDPEIAVLIRKYGLNREADDEFEL